jgi:sulfatase maturation enzyme AslB (radical SAM superfamily)
LGGEPTVDPDTIAFLEKLIEEGNTNLKLNITSNCTNFNKHWQLFKQFNKLNVCASLDGVGKTYDYIRTNAKWDSVLQNINQLQTLPNLTHLSINMVVQMYNIFDVKEWARFFYNIREAGKRSDKSVGAAYIQACEEPPHFHPSILFKEDKKFIIKEINDLIKEENIKDEEFIERTLTPVQTCLNDPIWNSFDPDVFSTIKPNSVEELRYHFKKHTRTQDKIRNTIALWYLHPRIKKYLI